MSQLCLCHHCNLAVRKCSLVTKVDSRCLFSQLVHPPLTARSQRLALACLLCPFLSFCKEIIFLDDCTHLWPVFTPFSAVIRSPGCATCVFSTTSALRTFLRFGYSSWWSPLGPVEVLHSEQAAGAPFFQLLWGITTQVWCRNQPVRNLEGFF